MFLVLVFSRSDSSRCSWLQPGINLFSRNSTLQPWKLVEQSWWKLLFPRALSFPAVVTSTTAVSHFFADLLLRWIWLLFYFCWLCVYLLQSDFYSRLPHLTLSLCKLLLLFAIRLWHVLTPSEDVIIVKLALKLQQGQPNLKPRRPAQMFLTLFFVYIRFYSWILILFWVFV